MDLKKLVTVKWLKPGPGVGYGYPKGATGKVEKNEAKKLEKNGFVKIVETPKASGSSSKRKKGGR
jgi:hypothetical protein